MYAKKLLTSLVIISSIVVYCSLLKAAEQHEFTSLYDDEFIGSRYADAYEVYLKASEHKNNLEKLDILHHFIALVDAGRMKNPSEAAEIKDMLVSFSEKIKYELHIKEMALMPLDQLFNEFLTVKKCKEAAEIIAIAKMKVDSVEKKKEVLEKFLELINKEHLSHLKPGLPFILTSEIENLKEKPVSDKQFKEYDLKKYSTPEKRIPVIMSMLKEVGIDAMKLDADNIGIHSPDLPSGVNRPQFYADIWDPGNTKKAVLLYKIHLMPKDQDFLSTVIALFNAMKNDPELNKVITVIKVKPLLEIDLLEQLRMNIQAYEYPKIIIYSQYGKEYAQIALDKIYNIFKDQHGVDRAPLYNEKVTDLIYFAQGNREDKEKERKQHLYEQPDMVYFKDDATGKIENYHLVNPNPEFRK